ncbi:DNA-directed DNA polymerase delta [Allomyces arbusculus]|nr:DNA-directed DNA polymerase delta [Allomyces arbusculus]
MAKNRVRFHDFYPWNLRISACKEEAYTGPPPDEKSCTFTREKYRYEVELEYTGKTFSPKELGGVTELCQLIFKRLQDSESIVSYGELFNTTLEYEMLTKSSGFIGSLPDALHGGNMALLKAGPYMVTIKYDGVRCLLFMSDNDRIYRLGRSHQWSFTGLGCSLNGGTILDAEYIKSTDTYHVFDILFYRGCDLRGKTEYSLKARIDLVNSICNDMKQEKLVPKKYYDTESFDTSTNGSRLKAAHGIVKRTLIETAAGSKAKLRVLELGCGRGGDIYKWDHLNRPVELVGVDVNESFIAEAQNRIKTSPPKNVKVKFVECDLTKENPAVSGKFDIVIFPVKTLVQNAVMRSYGAKINVKFTDPSFITNLYENAEYLVFPDTLITDAQKCGLKLTSTDVFQPSPDSRLDAAEEMYSVLNRWYIFQKSPRKTSMKTTPVAMPDCVTIKDLDCKWNTLMNHLAIFLGSATPGMPQNLEEMTMDDRIKTLRRVFPAFAFSILDGKHQTVYVPEDMVDQVERVAAEYSHIVLTKQGALVFHTDINSNGLSVTHSPPQWLMEHTVSSEVRNSRQCVEHMVTFNGKSLRYLDDTDKKTLESSECALAKAILGPQTLVSKTQGKTTNITVYQNSTEEQQGQVHFQQDKETKRSKTKWFKPKWSKTMASVEAQSGFACTSDPITIMASKDFVTFNVFSYTVDDGQEDPNAKFGYHDVKNFQYTLHLFGRTDEGKSVALHVEDYKPTLLLQLKSQDDMTISNYLTVQKLIRDWVAFPTYTNDRGREVVRRLDAHVLNVDDPIVERKNIWGFSNGELFKFFKFQFRSQYAFKKALNKFKYNAEEVHNEFSFLEGFTLFDDVEPMLRFFHERNIKTAGWVQIPRPKCIPRNERLTRCALEYTTSAEYVFPSELDHICPKIVECAFDIEVYSHDESFPKPEIEENCVFQIGVTLKNYEDTDLRKYLLHCGVQCNPIDNVECLFFKNERELLLGFSKFIVEHDVDVISGWNTDGFDWSYLFKRADLHKISRQFGDMSRVRDFVCKIKKDTFSSSAYGTSFSERIESFPGRLPLDAMIFVQRGFEQYDSYSLNHVAEKKLGQQKEDVSPKEIFRYFASQDPVKVTKIGKYCVQDTSLVQLLSTKLDMVTQLFEMANITFVPVTYLLTRGQQIRVFSQISKFCLDRGYSIPNIDRNVTEGYTGAIVLEPETGLYTDPVAVLDFSSLYPSCMVGYNLDYSTIVLDKKYDNLPGVEYHDVEWTEADGTYKCYRYAQKVPSILPDMQRTLWASRKAVKKMLKGLVRYDTVNGEQVRVVTDQFRYSVLTGREQAIKVTMNSMYGFLAAQKMPMPVIASSVTACGRQLIVMAKKFMENDFAKIIMDRGLLTTAPEFRVIYGDTDSVFVQAKGLDVKQANELFPIAEKIMNESVFVRESQAIEYEKVYSRYVLFCKKKYVGFKHMPDDNINYKLDYKGICLTRRNYAQVTKKIFHDVIMAILTDPVHGVESGLQQLKAGLHTHRDGQFPMELYVTSVKIGAEYKNPQLFQPKLVKRVAARGDEPPKSGERISYVVLTPTKREPEMSDRCELYSYAKMHNLKLDRYYYLHNQIRSPVMDIFKVIGPAAEAAAGKIFDTVERQLKGEMVRAKTGQRDISSFFLRR